MKTHRLRLTGGLDTSSAPMSLPEGCVIGSKNYIERVVDGGYESTGHFERCDGQPRPSDAEILAIEADGTWTTAAVVGSTATGGTSGATGTICYYSDTLLALTDVTGTVINGEVLLVGAASVGIADTSSPSVSPLVLNDMHAGAQDIYRADIEEPPGSGPVRGVCVVSVSGVDAMYAFRDSEDGTKQQVWKSSAAGWVAIDYPNTYIAHFTAGGGTYDGGSLILAQGANTASMHRMHINSGSLADGDAEGWLILRGSSAPGAFSSGGGSVTSGGGAVFTCTLTSGSKDYQAYTLLPGGRWQFKRYAYGDAGMIANGTIPVYGVDRLVKEEEGGNFIEFDGLIVAPIHWSDFPTRYPERLETHKHHLWIATGPDLYFSGIGNPGSWTAFTGGGNIGFGDNCTEMMSLQGSEDQAALLVAGDDKTMVVYGNDATDWNGVPMSRQVGAKPYTMQQMDSTTLALDQQGVRDFKPTQAFGNFTFNTLTNHVRRNVVGRAAAGSTIDRNGGRYRLFFDDGTWLCGTPRKGRWSWMFGEYPLALHFVQDWELDGEPVMLAGGSDGMVYMLDKGRSADGEPVEAWLKMAYAHCGDPMQRKAFRALSIEIRGDSAGELQVLCDYSYGDTAIGANAPSDATNSPIPPPGTPWDLGTWDTGTWDSQYATTLDVGMEGVGTNVSVTFYSRTAKQLPHHLTTLQHHYLDRRRSRGR